MEAFPLPAARLDEAAAYATACNARPEDHVGYLPDGVAAAAKALRGLEPSPGNVFALQRDGALTGLLALEYDAGLGRAWLWGPWCDGEGWAASARTLVAAARAAVPPPVTMLELWFDSRHRRLLALARELGFTLYKRAFPYGFDRADLHRLPDADAAPAAAGQRDALIALHEASFPGTYFTGAQLYERVAAEPERYRLLAEGAGGACHGYVFLEAEPEVGAAHIHFLGVDPDRRRRGVGRRLLHAGTRWMLSRPGVDRVGLLVEPDNPGAIRLYESAGWTRERETEAWRLDASPA